jgi:hypothetical protein
MVHPFILGYKQGAWYIFYHLCSLLCWIKIFNFVEHLTSETGVCHVSRYGGMAANRRINGSF